MHDNSQAVSESLGYIMIFAVVVACIAIMYVMGSQIIASNQESTSFQSMQQNFNVIQSNLIATASGSSPVKTTTFNVNYGTLSLLPEDESGSLILINFDGHQKNVPLGTLLFNASSSGAIALEDGAIITSYDWDSVHDSLMTQEPRLFYSGPTGTLMICTVNIKSTPSAVSSSYSSLRLNSTTLPQITNITLDGSPVEVCVRTNFTNAWSNYLMDIPGLNSNRDTTSPPEWANVTLSDPLGIRKIIIVNYNINAELG